MKWSVLGLSVLNVGLEQPSFVVREWLEGVRSRLREIV